MCLSYNQLFLAFFSSNKTPSEVYVRALCLSCSFQKKKKKNKNILPVIFVYFEHVLSSEGFIANFLAFFLGVSFPHRVLFLAVIVLRWRRPKALRRCNRKRHTGHINRGWTRPTTFAPIRKRDKSPEIRRRMAPTIYSSPHLGISGTSSCRPVPGQTGRWLTVLSVR